MKETTNYNLKKIELTDSPPDITVLNNNWDTIDEELKSQADAHESHLEESVHQGINNTVSVTSTDNATSTTDAPLKSAGGLAVAKDALINGFIQRDLGNGNYLTQYGHIRYFNSNFKTVEKDKKLVYTFNFSYGSHSLIKVIVGGGQSGSGGNLSMAIEKDFIVDTDYSNNAVVNGTKTGIIHGFDDNDVYIEGTPSNLRVVIEQKKRTAARLIPSIEIRNTTTITFVNQTIEDI